MKSWRSVVQMLVILVCLLYGGNQVRAEVLAAPAPASATVSGDPSQDNAYSKLPAGVARATTSVVALRRMANETNGEVASGVYAGGQQVLTAAHVIMSDGRLKCSQTTVFGSETLSGASVVGNANYAAAVYGKGKDLAIVTTNDDSLASLPEIQLANTAPAVGTMVFFINYQPTANGTIRNPSNTSSDVANDDTSKPAVFSGVILGVSEKGTVIATGNGQSFGIGSPDNSVRRGASGGAVVDSKGKLVGLSVSGESLVADTAASEIRQQYGVRLPVGKYQIAYAQPVSGRLIASIQANTFSCN